ncbi:MAG: ThuA domain-containing protein [Candidatus Hydrogenedentes bacterium]|nr:ThuA domain-containing protein [Candidatus Hydrogenedentota bacterium]
MLERVKVKVPFFIFAMAVLIVLVIVSKPSLSLNNQSMEEKIKVAVIIGGHDYDKKAFEEMWASFSDFSVEYFNYRVGECKFFDNPPSDKWDVVVFYNMNQQLNRKQQKNFLEYLKQGRKMIFLHHAVSAFPKWEEFPKILGGRYFLEDKTEWEGRTYPRSTYKHDVKVNIKVIEKEHPITKDVGDFEEIDEIYGNYYVSPSVKLLLATEHPESVPALAWINGYLNGEILFIQPGHGPQVFSNPQYRKLIHNAVMWAVKEK